MFFDDSKSGVSNKPVRRRNRRQAHKRRRQFLLESLEQRALLASDWQNPFIERDVTGDGVVTPIDALSAINELNSRTVIAADGRLPPRAEHPASPLWNVNGDDFLTPNDVLIVFNALNADVTGPAVAIELARDTAPRGATNSDRITSDATIAGRAEDDLTGISSVFVQIDSRAEQRVTLQRDGSFTLETDLQLDGSDDGEHTLRFRAADGRLNATAPVVFTFTFDTTAPAAPTNIVLDPDSDRGPSNSDGVTNDNTPTVRGDAAAGSTIVVSVNGAVVGTGEANSPWAVTTSTQADGQLHLTAMAEDVAGNASPASSPLSILVDTAAPVAQSTLSGTLNQTFSVFDVSYDSPMSPAAFAPAAYGLRVVGGANDGQVIGIGQVTEFPNSQAFLDVGADLPDQGYRLTIDGALTDLAGNPLAGPTMFEFALADPAGIADLSPGNGATQVGVTRETVVRFDEPVDPSTITLDAFHLIAKGERVLGRIVTSPTERFATFFYDAALPPSTEVRVVVDGDRIMGRDGRALDADGDDQPGGMKTADFTTLALTRIPGTELFGYVYDAANRIPQELLPIAVPSGDPQFDPAGTGSKTIPFQRAEVIPGTGTTVANPRQFVNEVTSFIDASMVYGSTESRARALRRLDGSGQLKTSDGELLPINNADTFLSGPLPVKNDGPFSSSELPVAGDVRAAEVPTLTAMHTLWVREHNRYATEVKAGNPRWTDDQIYEAARRWVGALIQQISYQEFLPTILGPDPLPAYRGYQPTIDPNISALFSTAAFRIGHTLQSGSIQRLDANGQSLPGGPLVIRNAFFNPNVLRDDGLDAYLRGMAAGQSQEFDLQIIDDLRNFLFGPPGAGGLDLASINIQRGRDMGLPGYNQARVDRGLPRVTSFGQITSNAAAATALAAIYVDVDKVDVWIGGLAEDHVPGGVVGPLFAAIIQDQFQRSRDGDRFWYENGQFNDAELAELRATRLSDVIERNSGVTGLPDNVFTTGTENVGPGSGGRSGSPAETRSFNGYGNNETDEHLGEAHWPLRVDYTVSFGDGISSPAGANRPNPRAISNALVAQSGNTVNSAGLTDLAITWGQFLDHDMDLTPAQTSAGTNIPVQGATIRVDAFPSANAVTDAHGFFQLEDMPAPEFFVHIDGTTATNAPAGMSYPSVGKPFHSIPGQREQLSMAGMPFNVYLPPMAAADVQPLSDTQETDVGFGDAGMDELERMFPDIPPAEWGKVKVTFSPGAAINEQGAAATQAVVIPVPPDRLPAPLPPNVDPRLVISIQAPGATNLNVPAPITYPNLDNLPLGAHATLFSFDHDVGAFVPVGTLEVVSDGAGGTILISDPGVGVVAPGWHYVTPPLNWIASCGTPEGNKPINVVNPPVVDVKLFVTGEADVLSLKFLPPPGPGQRVGNHQCATGDVEPKRVVEITVKGPFDSFYDTTGGLTAGLAPIVLKTGDPPVNISAKLRTLQELLAKVNGGKPLDQDVVYGSEIRVVETVTLADGSTQRNTRILLPYLFVDQGDEDGTDRQLKFRDAVHTNNFFAAREYKMKLEGAPLPFFQFDGAAAADFRDTVVAENIALKFDPSATGDRSAEMKVMVTVDGMPYTSVTKIPVQGKGKEGTRIYLNKTAAVDAAKNQGKSQASADTIYAGIKTHLESIIQDLGNNAQTVITVVDGDSPPAGERALTVIWNFADDEYLDKNGDGVAQVGEAGDVDNNGVYVEKAGEYIDLNRNGMADVGEFDPAKNVDLNGNGMQDVAGDYIDYNRNGRFDEDSLLGRAFTGVDFMTTTFGSKLVTDKDKYGAAQQAYIFDSLFDVALTGSFELMIDNIFKGKTNAAAGVYGGITVAHEAFHTFGMVHSDNMGIGNQDIQNHTNPPANRLTKASRFAMRAALDLTVSSSELNQDALPAYRTGYDKRGDAPPAFPSLWESTVFFEGPSLALLNDADEPFLEAIAFPPVTTDGIGNSQETIQVTIQNPGDENLVIQNVTFAPGGRGFSVSGFTPGVSIVPDGELNISLTFDPTTIGDNADSLIIATNATGPSTSLDNVIPRPGDSGDDVFGDPNAPPPDGRYTFALKGRGLNPDPVFQFDMGNLGSNNLGGVARGATRTVSDMLVIRNDGAGELVFTPQIVSGGIDFQLGNFVGVEQRLASLATMQIPLTFAPSGLGLLPGLLQFTTNDPVHLLVKQGVIGTGVPPAGVGPTDFHWGRDFVRLVNGPVVHQLISNDAGFFQAGLGVNSSYEVTVFDPVSGYIAAGTGMTGPSGALTGITRNLAFGPDTSPDSDFDGLPDDSEAAIGCFTNRKDSDGDGLSDWFEIQQGLDPLGSLRLPTGVIASLELPGTVASLAVADDLIYVATAGHGLAIVNGRKFDNPIILGQLALAGSVTGIGVDHNLNIAALATGNGLALVDIADPMLPRLIRTVSINAQRVVVHEGVAYAAVGGDIAVVDLTTGEVLQTLDTDTGFGGITGMARDGRYLYAFDRAANTFLSIDISIHNDIRVAGRTFVFVASGDVGLHAGNGVAWLAGSGLRSIDISDPTHPRQIGSPSGGDFFDSRRIALNGSGLGVMIPDFAAKVEVFDVSQLTVTDNKVLEFPLTGRPGDVAISRGLAYVGHGNELAVVNYLPFDNLGDPPTVAISAPVADEVPGQPGIQVFEGTTIPIRVDVIDDVQVQRVDLVVDGQTIETDVSFPFDFTVSAPELTGTGLTPVVVRAIDTGGNVATSMPLDIQVVDDTIPPTVSLITPAENSVRGELFRTVRVTFSERMDPATLIADNLRLSLVATPIELVSPTNIQIRDHGRTVQFTYDRIPPGENQLLLKASALRDVAGNPLGAADLVHRFTVLDATALWINPAGGNWDDPTNWEGNQLPGADDHVLINVPGNVTITHRSGDTHIKSLTSANKLTLSGGKLDVDTFVEVRNTFTLQGGILANATLTRRSDLPSIVVASLGNVTLDRVTLDNNLKVANGANVTLRNGLVLNGTLTVASGVSSTGLDIAGTQSISGTGRIEFTGSIAGRSRITTNVGETLTIGEEITIQASVGARIGLNGGLVIDGTIIANATGQTTNLLGSSVDNRGTLDARAGTLSVASPTNFAGGTLTGGVWRAGPGATLNLEGANIVTNQAHVTIDGSSTQILNGSGVNAFAQLATNGASGVLSLLAGKTLVTTTGLNNAGLLNISAGSRLQVGGSFQQSDTASLNIGISSSSQFGSVAATGAATLDGDLNLDVATGLVLQLATLTPLTFTSRTGEFDAVNQVPTTAPFLAEYRNQRLLLQFGASFAETATLPFTATFNDGGLGEDAVVRTNAFGRVAVSSNNGPRTGGRHLVLDSIGGGSAANDYIIPLMIDAVTPIQLGFYHKSFDTSADPMPATFTGSISCDGISMSTDGLHWFRVADLSTATSSTYEPFLFDLRAIASAAGLTLTDRLLVKFQQFGSGSAPSGGRAFDDVRIGADVVGPRVTSIAPAGPLVFAADLRAIVATFNEPLSAASATSPANYVLVRAGADGQFSTIDDVRVALAAPEFDGTLSVTLRTADGQPLPPDTYRLTLKGQSTITDAANVPLLDGLDSVSTFTLFGLESPTNDTQATATATGITAAGGAFAARAAIGDNGAGGTDLDLYSLAAGANQFVRAGAVRQAVAGMTTALDLRIRLLTEGGVELASANTAASDDAQLTFRTVAAGTYFVEVTSAASKEGLYQFTVSSGGSIADFPVTENFEIGPPLAAFWETSSTATGRIRVTDSFDPIDGHFHLVADTNTPVDPWLLVHQEFFGPNLALSELGLLEGVDYTVATPGDLAALTAAQIAAFDVVFVTSSPSEDFGLVQDENQDARSDLSEALAGVGTTGRAVLSTLFADTSLPNGQERDFLRNALNWLRAGQTTGLLALADPNFRYAWTPWSADLENHVPDFNANNSQVSIVQVGHEVMTNLNNAGLSNWVPAFNTFVDRDLPGFSTLAVVTANATRRVAFAMDGAEETLPAEDRRPSLHEAILHVNLSGQANVELQFDARLFDESTSIVELPSMFTGSFNGTGIALSVDGSTWFNVFTQEPFGNLLRFHSDGLAVDLDEFAAKKSLVLGGDVQIKFQHFEFGPAPFRGVALDNIRLQADRVGPTVSFVQPVDSVPHTRPVRVVTGDVNGDSVPDIVVGNSGFGGAVSVFLNAGGPPTSVNYLPFLEARDIALFDTDGDSDLDLVAIVRASGNEEVKLAILLNNGAGIFGSLIEMPLSAGAADLAIGEINGDTRPDVVVANGGDRGGSPSATLLLSDGVGGSYTPAFLNMPVFPKSIALADVDGDTDLDIVAVGPSGVDSGSAIAVLTNDLIGGPVAFAASSSFTFAGSIGVADGANDIVLGDLNGDIQLDAVTSGSDSGGPGSVSVRLGELGGLFSGGADFLIDEEAHSLALGRMDGDADLDVVVVTRDANGASAATVLLNDGAGLFPAILKFPTGADSRTVAIADVNGDSKNDAVTASGINPSFFASDEVGNISVLFGGGNGSLAAGQPLIRDVIEFPQGFISISDLQIGFDEVGGMNEASLTDLANYRLIEAGPDGQFDPPNDPTPDDRVVTLLAPVVIGFGHGRNSVRIPIAAANLPLPAGKYRLTIKGTATIRDAEGNPLNDSDGDGVGADFVESLVIMENGPVVESRFPQFDAGLEISELTLVFSEPIAAGTFTVDDVTGFRGPGGETIAPTSVSVTGRTAVIHFPVQVTQGFYSLQIGPDIRDLAGNPMNSNFNATFGQNPGDTVQASFEVSLSHFDEDGFIYDWQANNATVLNGGRRSPSSDPTEQRFDAYDSAYLLAVGSAAYSDLPGSPVLEDAKRTIVFPTKTLAGLTVHREVYVPAIGGNFARLLDVFRNPTATAITTTVMLSGNLSGSPPLSVTTTSSGDAAFNVADNWFASDDATDQASAPELAHLLQDGQGLIHASAATFNATQGSFQWLFQVTVNPGETVRLLSFAIQTDGRAAAAAEAADLQLLPARAIANLSAAELASIVNFNAVVPLRLAVGANTGYADSLDGGDGGDGTDGPNVKLAQLRDAAVTLWVAAGLDERAAATLRNADVQFGSLPGNLLAVTIAGRNAIVVDRDAAGRGWFFDATPEDDVEFIERDPSATQSVDLLTVLAHEFGHLLGAEHSDDEHDFLFDTLGIGQRRTPWSAAVDAVFRE